MDATIRVLPVWKWLIEYTLTINRDSKDQAA